jgi:hypothetical protein
MGIPYQKDSEFIPKTCWCGAVLEIIIADGLRLAVCTRKEEYVEEVTVAAEEMPSQYLSPEHKIKVSRADHVKIILGPAT